MVIDNDIFDRRNDVHSLLTDNPNVFKVTYFKESGKYYTEEFYELWADNILMHTFSDAFKKYCKDYNGMIAVIEFNDNHKTGYPLMILPEFRR